MGPDLGFGVGIF
jgi:hypothetical protein